MDYKYIEIPDGNHVTSITRNPEMIADVFDFFDARVRGKKPVLTAPR